MLHSSKSSSTRLPQRVLFVRLDRIGDLVLTLPVDHAFDVEKSHWWIPRGLSFVTQSAVPTRKATETARKIGLKEFFARLVEVRKEQYEAAVVFHAPWWVGCLLWLARVPIRIGVRSQWHSFLFFNRGVRQKRSRAECSELEYNYLLLEHGFKIEIGTLERKHLKLEAEPRTDHETFLREHGLSASKYFVVHPGMGGSALNWPTRHYIDLILKLSKESKVAITGTAADETYLAPIRLALGDVPNVVWLDQKLKSDDLVIVLACARSIVAPSTGVLHLASSTGQPTLGLFSPVRVQQPKRWGPQGQQTRTLMPNVLCPGEMACLGHACKFYDCMRSITVAEVINTLRELEKSDSSN